jgi:hypothetical protein
VRSKVEPPSAHTRRAGRVDDTGHRKRRNLVADDADRNGGVPAEAPCDECVSRVSRIANCSVDAPHSGPIDDDTLVYRVEFHGVPSAAEVSTIRRQTFEFGLEKPRSSKRRTA